MIRKLCPSCGEVMERGHSHRSRRGSSRRKGYDPIWDNESRKYRQAHPICEWPEGCIKPSKDVHHLDGEPQGPRRLDWENLQALCRSHHAQITSQRQPGGWNVPGYERA